MNKLKQSTQLKQKKVLSHQTRQAINILQLNSIMLEARLYQELESNPALEIIESEPNQDSDTSNDTDEDSSIDYSDEDYDNWNTSQKSNEDFDSSKVCTFFILFFVFSQSFSLIFLKRISE